MKRRIWMVALAGISFVSFAVSPTGDETGGISEKTSGPAYNYSKAKSTLYWEGNKPGGKHHGTIEVIGGSAITDGNRISGGSFEIDMSSIRNDDVKNEGMRNRLLGHLKSEDFFFVEKYPMATFEITRVEASGGSTHLITGDLTIRGNTNEISFPAEIKMDDEMIHAQSGEIVLDRTRWDVNHMSKSIFAEMKDNFINDEMIVKLDVHLSRN